MGKSYGFYEIIGVVAALDALDIMCKAANVELCSWERKLGGRLVTIMIQGDVSAVTEAIESAAAKGIKKPASYVVIANPHEEIVRLVELSRSRWDKTMKKEKAAGPETGSDAAADAEPIIENAAEAVADTGTETAPDPGTAAGAEPGTAKRSRRSTNSESKTKTRRKNHE